MTADVMDRYELRDHAGSYVVWDRGDRDQDQPAGYCALPDARGRMQLLAWPLTRRGRADALAWLWCCRLVRQGRSVARAWRQVRHAQLSAYPHTKGAIL